MQLTGSAPQLTTSISEHKKHLCKRAFLKWNWKEERDVAPCTVPVWGEGGSSRLRGSQIERTGENRRCLDGRRWL